MKRFFPFLVPLFFLLFFAFCGKIGPILPPLKRVLQKIEVLDITQRGDKIILEWENPTAYTDGSSLSEISEVEIWLVEQERESGGEKKQVSLEEFERRAMLVASIKKEKFSEYQTRRGDAPGKIRYFYRLSGKDYASKSLTFGLRVKEIGVF